MSLRLTVRILILFCPVIVSAQIDSSLKLKKTYYHTPVLNNFIAPAIFTACGLATLHQKGFLNKNDIQEFMQAKFGKTNTNIDDYLAFTPMVSVTGLNWSGVKPKNDFYNRVLLYAKSELLMVGIVYGLKYSTHIMRPDSSDFMSFPSGHTAQAFMSATIMHKEFKDKSLWYSVAGYTTATIVGVLRILNNRHWAPDVLVGAAAGILSVNLVYQTHLYSIFPKKYNGAYIYPFSAGRYNGVGIIVNL